MDNDEAFPISTVFDDDETEELLFSARCDIAPFMMFLVCYWSTAVQRVTNFAEATVPSYSMNNFCQHFLLPPLFCLSPILLLEEV